MGVLTNKLAEQAGIPANEYLEALQSALGVSERFRPSKAELTGFLLIADKYGFDPFAREIWCMPARNGRIMPVVSYDGWLKHLNRQPGYDGMGPIKYADTKVRVKGLEKDVPEWVEVSIYDKTRAHPTVKRVYFTEVCQVPWRNGKTGQYVDGNAPWAKMPIHMMEIRGIIQAIRIAYPLGGVFDEDTARAIVDADADETPQTQRSDALRANSVEGVNGAAPATGSEVGDSKPTQLASRRYPTINDKEKLDLLLEKIFKNALSTSSSNSTPVLKRVMDWATQRLEKGETLTYAILKFSELQAKQTENVSKAAAPSVPQGKGGAAVEVPNQKEQKSSEHAAAIPSSAQPALRPQAPVPQAAPAACPVVRPSAQRSQGASPIKDLDAYEHDFSADDAIAAAAVMSSNDLEGLAG